MSDFEHNCAAKGRRTARRPRSEEHVPTTTHDSGFFVRAEDAFGAAVFSEEAR
ncbi:hypothetical protein AB0L41_47175 [Amycolatopsis mediterranei]|uniref:hypothetical protein n=1 Tax=Amycolatopsis mediterranei TaxID=33910 RepID=UPI0034129454